jgi:tetrapyrrole methylase family protein/MazG family protein
MKLAEIMARLRGPDGCPWDKHQSHESLLPYLFEESRELRSAVKKHDWDNVCEELGDVLLQVVFHAQLAREKKRFTIKDVIDGLNRKLVRRHPHVFAGMKLNNKEEVILQWKKIKKQEKKKKLPV